MGKGPTAKATRVLKHMLIFSTDGCGSPRSCCGLCPNPGAVGVSIGVALCCQGSAGRSPWHHCPFQRNMQGNIFQRLCLPSGSRKPVPPYPGFPTVPSPLPHLSHHPQQQRLSMSLKRQVPVFGSFLLRRKTMKKQKPRKSRREGNRSLCSEETAYLRNGLLPPRGKQEGHKAGSTPLRQ